MVGAFDKNICLSPSPETKICVRAPDKNFSYH